MKCNIISLPTRNADLLARSYALCITAIAHRHLTFIHLCGMNFMRYIYILKGSNFLSCMELSVGCSLLGLRVFIC